LVYHVNSTSKLLEAKILQFPPILIVSRYGDDATDQSTTQP
jgi:hypothetical protein